MEAKRDEMRQMLTLPEHVRRLAGGVLVCTALAMTACEGEIAGWKVTAAQEVCASRGGIDRLTNTFGSGVVCRDGYWQEIKRKS